MVNDDYRGSIELLDTKKVQKEDVLMMKSLNT